MLQAALLFCRAVNCPFVALSGLEKAHSFAIFGLRVGLCELQMCVLCAVGKLFTFFL